MKRMMMKRMMMKRMMMMLIFEASTYVSEKDYGGENDDSKIVRSGSIH